VAQALASRAAALAAARVFFMERILRDGAPRRSQAARTVPGK